MNDSGCGAAWLARLLGVQEVPSSNLGSPTKFLKDLETGPFPVSEFWSPLGVQKWPSAAELLRAHKKLLKYLGPLSSYKKPDKPDIFDLTH